MDMSPATRIPRRPTRGQACLGADRPWHGVAGLLTCALVSLLLLGCHEESDQAASDPTAAPAVPPSSLDLLPSDRRTSWSPGLPGGIPERKTACATLTASAFGHGSLDATPGIQAAI